MGAMSHMTQGGRRDRKAYGSGDYEWTFARDLLNRSYRGPPKVMKSRTKKRE